MRRRALIVAVAVLLAVGLLGTPATAAVEGTDQDIEDVVDAYNANVAEAPDVLTDRVADERVALTVERADEADIEYTVVTDETAEVVSIAEGHDDPTLRMTTNEATVDEIANAETPGEAAVDAYESDDIELEGVGLTNTVKVEATKLGYQIGSALGLL